ATPPIMRAPVGGARLREWRRPRGAPRPAAPTRSSMRPADPPTRVALPCFWMLASALLALLGGACGGLRSSASATPTLIPQPTPDRTVDAVVRGLVTVLPAQPGGTGTPGSLTPGTGTPGPRGTLTVFDSTPSSLLPAATAATAVITPAATSATPARAATAATTAVATA